MKKWLIIAFLVISITGCSPSETQILAAMGQTQTAMPTSTNVPTEEPIITNTPEPTEEPTKESDILFLQDVTFDDVRRKFSLVSLKCGEKISQPDGSYIVECEGMDWVMAKKGEITGFSNDTVSSYTVVFVPVGDEDISSKIEFNFSIFVNTGNDADEKVTWIMNNLPPILQSTEAQRAVKLFSHEYLLLFGHSGGAALTVSAQQLTSVPTD